VKAVQDFLVNLLELTPSAAPGTFTPGPSP
jgi:hypothetical protein